MQFVPRGTLFYHLPSINKRIFISLGEIPGILDACAMVSGSIFVSF